MANKCKNLKSFVFRFNVDQNSDIRQFLSQLKAISGAQEIEFEVRFFNRWRRENNIDVNQLFSFELFKGFSNITHLSLSFGWRHTLKESILKDIDINLPKLQYLEITRPFRHNSRRCDSKWQIFWADSQDLETIKLKFKSGVDFKPIEDKSLKSAEKSEKLK